MQDRLLLISTLIAHAGSNHTDTPIISKMPDLQNLGHDRNQSDWGSKSGAGRTGICGVTRRIMLDAVAGGIWNDPVVIYPT
jgi:hypothetical protein